MSDGNNFNNVPGVLAAAITAIASVIGVWLNNQAPPEQQNISTVQIEEQATEHSHIEGDSNKTTNQADRDINTQNIGQNNNFFLISPAVAEDERDEFEPSANASSQGAVKAVLVAEEANSRINVRRGPGTNYDIRHYGIEGDYVNPLRVNADSNGWSWVEVEFPASGATGWIREDFISVFQE